MSGGHLGVCLPIILILSWIDNAFNHVITEYFIQAVLEFGALICFSHFNNPTRAGICVEVPGAAHAGVTVAYSNP